MRQFATLTLTANELILAAFEKFEHQLCSAWARLRAPGEQRSWLGCAHVATLVCSGRVRTANEVVLVIGVLQRGDLQLG